MRAYRAPPGYTEPDDLRFYGGDYHEFYVPWIDPIQHLGWQLGYNIIPHGSLRRDLDMVAIPWIEDCATDAVLAESIRELVDGRLYPNSRRGTKPHGRICWVIHFHGGDVRNIHKYIDLSVMRLYEPSLTTNQSLEK